MMTLAEKQELVGQLAERMNRAKACLLAEYKGLTVADLTQLRRSLDAHDGEFRIAKNRLVKRAVEDNTDFAPLASHLVGAIGITYLYGDLAQGIKQVLNFQKEHEQFAIKTAVMSGSVVSPAGLKEIADLPSKEVLMARIVGSVLAPHRQLVTVLQGVPQSLVMVLSALAEKKK